MDPAPIDWCPYKKRKFGPRGRCTQRAEDVKGCRERTATCKPHRGAWSRVSLKASEATSPADALVSDFWPPGL